MATAIAHPRSRTISIERVTPSYLVVAVAAFAVGLSLSARLDYAPIWDGYEYATAIHNAATGPFSPDELRFAGHASQAYALPLAIAQRLVVGQYWPILLVNTVLLVVAGIGFHRLTRLVLPDETYDIDRALITGAFVLQPALLAAVVQPGLDLPLVPGFLWATVFVLEGRPIWAALAGLALVFSKETGVLLYAALGAAYVLRAPRATLGFDGNRAEALKRLAILVVPGVVFGLYVAYRSFVARGEPAVWNAGTAMIGQSLLRQLLVPRIDRYLLTYIAIMLVLNFAWVMSLASVAAGVMAFRRASARGSVGREVREWLRTTPGFVVLLAAITAFALTRFATYANARYLLGFVGLLLAIGLVAFVSLPLPTLARRAILTAFAVLVGVSVERTIDPVSRGVFGTFPVGKHDLLRLTSITRECCALGRDQLAYNLEFTNVAAVTDFALETMRIGDSTMIVVPDSTNWRAIPRINPFTSRRAPSPIGGVEPLVTEADSAALFIGQRRAAVFVALPNGSAERGLKLLSRSFTIGPERRVVEGGYAVSVYRLNPRQVPLPSWAP